MNKIITLSLAAAVLLASAQAATVTFVRTGTAGSGPRGGHEPASSGTGSVGKNGAGISFDSLTMALAFNAAWGSAFGSVNLTGTVTSQPIPAATAANDASSFTKTAAVVFNLSTAITAATGGTISNRSTLAPAPQQDVASGNISPTAQTAASPAGAVPSIVAPAIPEPASAALLGLGTLLLAARRRRTVQV